MTFKQIAENLRTTGRKFKWGRFRLVQDWDTPEPRYCALGIKAAEFGVPTVVLAYVQGDADKAGYSLFGLTRVHKANDNAYTREEAIIALERLEQVEKGEPDIEGWVEYLKAKEPEAREWAKSMGYHSLLA